MKYVFGLIFITNIFIYTKCANLSNLQARAGNTTDAPYGTITGYASTNVPAYSNGNDSCVETHYNYLYGVYMGIKWQCVEYARRWLFIRKGCVFARIEGAADMWTQLNTVQRVIDNKTFPLVQYPNGSPTPPINESLLIYNRSGSYLPFGHVAVIVDVLPGYIRVAEENYDAYYWSGNYSRQIQYVLINGTYVILDDYPILGWMSVNDSNQTKPLDQLTINAIILLNQSSYHFISHSLLFFNLLLIIFHLFLL